MVDYCVSLVLDEGIYIVLGAACVEKAVGRDLVRTVKERHSCERLSDKALQEL